MGNLFLKNIAEQLTKALELSVEEISAMVEVPPDSAMGDYALPCFPLAKSLRKAPNLIAEELASMFVATERISGVRATGPYQLPVKFWI